MTATSFKQDPNELEAEGKREKPKLKKKEIKLPPITSDKRKRTVAMVLDSCLSDCRLAGCLLMRQFARFYYIAAKRTAENRLTLAIN